MKIELIARENARVGQWSGGTTTELFLWPPEGSYAARDFVCRISSADVTLDESDFTPLPGVTRWITPLTGGFTLTHPDGSGVTMAPLDPPYRFDGGIGTHCRGRAADFNLMLKGCGGEMAVVEGPSALRPGVSFIFLPAGGEVTVAGAPYALRPMDLLLIDSAGSVMTDGGKRIVCRMSRAMNNEE